MIYKLEVWQAPDGSVIRAILPLEVRGSHFGYQLRALLHNLYALGMTEPGLFDMLRGSGIEISEGQVHNILMHESEEYHAERCHGFLRTYKKGDCLCAFQSCASLLN